MVSVINTFDRVIYAHAFYLASYIETNQVEDLQEDI